jgi:hypothetical protein
MDPETAERRRRMTVRKFASNAEADAADIEYWRTLSETERILQVWRLSLAQWAQSGDVDDAPRLHRTVTRVLRG